jgi:hypothetical protein
MGHIKRRLIFVVTKITLTVWKFAGDCGGSVNYNAISDTNNANVTFEFQASLYKIIDTSAVDETRIVNTSNVLRAGAVNFNV